MLLIQQVTNAPFQQQNLVLPDGSSVLLQLYFRPMQLGWFVNKLVYGSFELNSLRITNSPNILHQFRNQVPFGLACISTNNREPSLQQDFTSGASNLYLLTEDEVKEYTRFLSNG